jgi:hypothetical protein
MPTATAIATALSRASGRYRPAGNPPGPAAAGATEQNPIDQLCLLSDLERGKLQITVTPIDELCAWCVEHGSKGCPACTQRRRKVVRLHDEDSLTIAEIATRTALTVERVERLLEQERDRRETERFRISHVANEQIRKLFLRRKAQDSDFSAAKLARLARLSCSSHVERELGLIATSAAVKNGVEYPRQIKSTIGVDNAERLLRGMGLHPRDIERILDGEQL